ncbi:hypothetical protein [Nitratireductor sp. ZSWI3]|uniref:hypothetical protein n=1 Tax=Nitratireductor sp. ZSWI3 TaxID=2966359 RepID=UPI00214F8E78|nr:hypothetical protein [Nitratireductor sp. ZSWI3]MCR4264851.1 hypothetical protein [Nitratireductor sp. ZSWI3]
MSRNRTVRFILPACLGILLSGCADYMNHYDTVTLEAGNAQGYNRLLHADQPFNPASHDLAIGTDGTRAADAVRKYKDSQKPGAQPQTNVTVNVGNVN